MFLRSGDLVLWDVETVERLAFRPLGAIFDEISELPRQAPQQGAEPAHTP